MGGAKQKDVKGAMLGQCPSAWHAFCSCSIPGALGFVAFSSLTLSGTVKAAFC